MIYEVINPSDPVAIEADDVSIARAAVLIIGEGSYALTDEEGKTVLPIFIFGGGDQFEAWEAREGFNFAAILKDRKPELAACLRSAACMEMRDRRALLAAVGSDPGALERFNEERRSSLNDICGRAHMLADALERAQAAG